MQVRCGSSPLLHPTAGSIWAALAASCLCSPGLCRPVLGLCPRVRTVHPALQVYGLQEENWEQSALSIVVVGASGDLAKKKIFPALFALYYEKMLPKAGPGSCRAATRPSPRRCCMLPQHAPPISPTAAGAAAEREDIRIRSQQDER